MGLGRRKVGIHDPSAWVFNRMVEAYAFDDALSAMYSLMAAAELPDYAFQEADDPV